MRKVNHKYMKSSNQGLILKVLREKGPLSRIQISKEIGLVRSTVSEITNELIKLNIIKEGEKVKGAVGKRPTLLFFNNEYFYFLAIVISPEDVYAALCNLDGEILEEKRVKYGEGSSAKDVLELSFSILDELLGDIDPDKICLLSLGSPETFNKKTGVIGWAPYVKDWIGINLGSIFKDKYKFNVVIKDHIKLETLGEYWKNFNDVSNMVYIKITRGIGAGAIIDGKVREGKDGYLGEIGFLPLAEKLNYEDIKKDNKNLGYWESRCNVISIEKLIKNYFKFNNRKEICSNLENISNLYKNDLNIKKIINENILKTLSLGFSATIIILNPAIVVINGEVLNFGSEFLKLLREEIYNIVPYKPQITFSRLGYKSGIYGAIKNGLNYIEKLLYQDPMPFINYKNILNVKP